MDWLRKHPLFAAIVFASAVASGFQSWLIHTARERTKLIDVQLAAKRQERDALTRQVPALTEQNERAIAADVAAAEKRLGEFRATLAGRVGLTPAPGVPVESYFALAAFVEEMRTCAARQRVALRTDERFGFALYASEGPPPELIASVHRQRIVLQHLLVTLFEARPESLVSVAREVPLTVAQRAARRSAATGETETATATPTDAAVAGEADFFTPDSRVRVRAPGIVDSELYRVEFTGRTAVLRGFLNALASSPLPLCVRTVEVEPATDADAAPSMTASTDAVPFVRPASSKFTVVVECVELEAASSS